MKKNSNGRNLANNSFTLFDDDSVVDMVYLSNYNGDSPTKKTEQIVETQQTGTQPTDEKPEQSEFHHEKPFRHTKRGFRAIENVESDSGSENTSFCEERHGNKKSSERNRETGKLKGGSCGSAERQNKRTRSPKQKIQKTEGGDGTGTINKTDREIIDYDKYPLSEFSESSRLISRKITGKPRETEDQFVVEVIIDGSRYKVSSCSIKGDTYVQGLDSRFIVSKLKF